MSTYVISDIHGHFDLFQQMLDMISFGKDDTLYVLGDFLDRGKDPVPLVQYMMAQDNIFPICGNHEYMALECLSFLMQEVSEETIAEFENRMGEGYVNWMENGGHTTLKQFVQLNADEREDFLDYLQECSLYEKPEINGTSYMLVHAGLGKHAHQLSCLTIEDLMFSRYDDSYNDLPFTVIHGHTPTHSGRIETDGNGICIDCGCDLPHGRLAALRLDDLRAFYIENPEGVE
ncbi:MAG: metallophosphoesterase [Bulleidia sp.]